MAEIERLVTELTNVEREQAGLQPLRHDPAISDIARAHSDNMARQAVFSHDVNGQDATHRALAAGYDCKAYHADGSYTYGLGENIYEHPRVLYWQGEGFVGGPMTWVPTEYIWDAKDMARSLVAGWMDSPGHRANIVDEEYRRIGVGVAVLEGNKHGYVTETIYATQNFSSCE